MSTALALASWLALGLPTAAVFWRRGQPELALAMLPFAGALAILLPAVAALWTGGDLGAWPARAALASVLVAAFPAALLRRAAPAGPAPPASPAATALACAALLGVAGHEVHTGIALTRGWPGYDWDGLAIWLVRARVLAADQPIPLELFSEPELRYGHWDYPLLLPALLAWFARVGGLELRELALPIGLFAALFPLATALGLRRTLRPPLAAAVALAPLAVPELLLFHHRAYADGLLVMLVTAALAWCAAGALHGSRALLAAGGIALAAAVSVKNEGVLWLAALVPGLVLLSAHRRLPLRPWLLELLGGVAPGLLLFALWRLTCAQLATDASLPSELRWDLVGTRWLPVLRALSRHVLTPGNAAVLLACIAGMFALAPGRPAERLLHVATLLSVPVAFLAGLSVVYLATPHELGWHVQTSMHRTVYGVVPAVFALTAFAGSLPPLSAAAGGRDRR